MSFPEPLFCCASAAMINHNRTKLHKDPNREIHHAIFNSFMNFAYRRQTAATLMARILCIISSMQSNVGSSESRMLSIDAPEIFSSPPRHSSTSSASSPSPTSPSNAPQQIPMPILTHEALRNNPITSSTPYVIHLTSRHDFGPVFSHRYFVCPSNLQHDWIEASLEHWFAVGADFKLQAEKSDVKCLADSKFYRLTLRPNLAMRFPFAEQQYGTAHGC